MQLISTLQRIGQGSLLRRVMVPVNLISLVLLSSLCAFMVWKTKSSVAATMQSKVESVAGILQKVGQTYLGSHDLNTLERFTKVVITDSDFIQVSYLDQNKQTLIESVNHAADKANTERFEREIFDFQGKHLGKVVMSFRNDRVIEAFWGALSLGFACLALTQLLLSGAIFGVCRSIINPLQVSLGRLSKTSNVLSMTSNDFSKFSELLASGVSEQAEVVQETTAAMTEMSSMLTQTSNHARQSEEIMNSMTMKTNSGMTTMNQMVEAMTSVQNANEHLKKMRDIIQEITSKTIVINDIVFKTQLLSFNASIEAARAGHHGRGFAVVAEEVGNLAKLSGTAAHEIAALLQASERQVNEIVTTTSERVATGQSVTVQALKNFKEIAADISDLSSQIANISAAAREQELGVAQTSRAMTELSKTTELNSQIAQRSEDTSRVLRTEIQALNSIAGSIEANIAGGESGSDDSIHNGRVAAHSDLWTGQNQTQSAPAPVAKGASNLSTQQLSDKIIEMALSQRKGGGRSGRDPNSKIG